MNKNAQIVTAIFDFDLIENSSFIHKRKYKKYMHGYIFMPTEITKTKLC